MTAREFGGIEAPGPSEEPESRDIDAVSVDLFSHLLEAVEEMLKVESGSDIIKGTRYTPELEVPASLPNGVRQTIQLSVFLPAEGAAYSPSIGAYRCMKEEGKVPVKESAILVRKHDFDTGKKRFRADPDRFDRLDKLFEAAAEYWQLAELLDAEQARALGFSDEFVSGLAANPR